MAEVEAEEASRARLLVRRADRAVEPVCGERPPKLGGDMAPAAVAGGVVRTVARRVGEGAINGLLTIRIGVAALEACRPMPFDARDRPSSTTLARQVLGG